MKNNLERTFTGFIIFQMVLNLILMFTVVKLQDELEDTKDDLTKKQIQIESIWENVYQLQDTYSDIINNLYGAKGDVNE